MPPRRVISYPAEGHAQCRQVEDRSFWFRHRSACLRALIQRFPPAGTIYDVGGGNGFVTRMLQDHGYDAVLVEPGRAGVDHARRLGVRRVIHGTLEDAGLADHSVHAVGIFDVLEHVHDDGAFLASLHRRLAPQGRLYVSVPAYPALWSAADERAGHARRYTRTSLLRALRAAGFAADHCSYVFSVLPLPIWLLRAAPNRLGLRRRRDPARVAREHGLGGGIAARLLAASLRWEPGALARGARIPFGASVVCAARSEAPR